MPKYTNELPYQVRPWYGSSFFPIAAYYLIFTVLL